MQQREHDPRRVDRAHVRCDRSLIALADRHREAVFAAHTHTQPAQPSTIAHYLQAVIEQLERDVVAPARGVCEHESQSARGLRDHRHRVSRSIVERTSDAARFRRRRPETPTAASRRSTTCSRASAAAAVLLAGLGRVRPGSAALVHERVRLSAARRTSSCSAAASCRRSAIRSRSSTPARSAARRSGRRRRILLTVHNTPFGDIVDTEDDLQPLVAQMFKDADRAVRLVAAAMEHADVRRDQARGARRRRAGSP